MHKDKETGKYSIAHLIKPEMNGNGHGSHDKQTWSCHWGGCENLLHSTDLHRVLKHVGTHLPDTSLQAPIHKVHNVPPERVEIPSSKVPFSWITTATDERGDAAGLPLASLLVLRNLARQMGKVDEGEKARGGRQAKWVERCFGPARERLGWIGAWNRSLSNLMPPLEFLVEKGLGLPTVQPVPEVEMTGY